MPGPGRDPALPLPRRRRHTPIPARDRSLDRPRLRRATLLDPRPRCRRRDLAQLARPGRRTVAPGPKPGPATGHPAHPGATVRKYRDSTPRWDVPDWALLSGSRTVAGLALIAAGEDDTEFAYASSNFWSNLHHSLCRANPTPDWPLLTRFRRLEDTARHRELTRLHTEPDATEVVRSELAAWSPHEPVLRAVATAIVDAVTRR
ncbi:MULTISPECIES: hypothetical protein [unclassified Actinoplanes]|uniref:hypothetical protein n=1 Tax=unclassified Actinoplanes TaxID=2626549 RepID=UPI0002F44F9E|nr:MULTISPECIES: hypothetical protein [unclassified Actinoplanes]